MTEPVCSGGPSHGVAPLRVSCDVPGEEERMVQHVCTACFFDTTLALVELGATRIIIADPHNEQRILDALSAATGGAKGKLLPR